MARSGQAPFQEPHHPSGTYSNSIEKCNTQCSISETKQLTLDLRQDKVRRVHGEYPVHSHYTQEHMHCVYTYMYIVISDSCKFHYHLQMHIFVQYT